MTELMTTVHVIEPRERIKRYGIECIGPAGDGIVFQAGTWKPGGEYIQKLIVRNVSTKVQHVKYRLPSTRYFSLAYPEEIVLSPGMFEELDVVFRPVHNDPYDDTIYLKILDGGENIGGFHVPVRACISKLEVTAPFGIDFGFCTTHQITSQTFLLSNTGEVDSPFRWESAEPFIISPMAGVIPVGSSQEITVQINPQGAHVFMVQAVCVVGEGVHAIIPEPKLVTRLSAVAKFSYLSLSESKIDFGEVLSGTSPDERPQEVLLRNSSVVPAEFSLTRHDNDRDEVFDIHPRSGIVPARGELTIKVKYSALASGSYSCDLYTFHTPGNSRTTLTCTGLAMQPIITFRKQIASKPSHGTGSLDLDALLDGPSGAPTNSINFGEVEVGLFTTRVFYLKNNSTRDTAYSIVADENGVFQMDPRQGVIPAGMEVSVKLTFSPHHPINFYRRIWILLGEALPLFYDAYGNGFIRARGEVKEQRPAPLRHAHIQAYRNRCVNGEGDLSPEDLDDMYEELQARGDGSERMAPQFAQIGMKGTIAMSVASLRSPLTRTGDASRTAQAVAHELFIPPTQSKACQGITIDSGYMDFGYAPIVRGSAEGSATQYITVTNHTRGKVAVVWCAPKVRTDKHAEAEAAIGGAAKSTTLATGFEKPIPESVFVISPSSAEIASKKSMKFKVTFSPRHSNRNFVNELECVAFFKNQRTFRLVNDTTLTPPWTAVVHAVGHTFEFGQLLSKARLLGGAVRSGKLSFPHCFAGDSIFQTIRLKNASNLPSVFRFEIGFAGGTTSGATGENVFSVRPEAGEVAPEDFVLICIRFSPNEANRKFVQLLRCIVNGSVGGQVLLEGNCGFPSVICPDVMSPIISTGQELLPINPQVLPAGFQGVFYMKPTAVGLSSTRTFRVKNCSRLPLRFVCSLPDGCEGILSISPLRGILKGNEECETIISFAPQIPKELVFKLRINVYPIGGDAPNVIDARQPGRASRVDPIQQLSMNIIAPGSGGAIIFDPPNVATPVQLVKTTENKNIIIENVSDSDLYYELYYGMKFYMEASTGAGSSTDPPEESPQELMHNAPANADYEEHRCIYCNKPSGIIPAKSRSIVAFSVNPNRAGLFEFNISCRLRTVGSDGELSMVANEEDVLLRMGVTKRAKASDTAAVFEDIDESEFTPTMDHVHEDTQVLTAQKLDLPLVATIVSRASFPTVMFEDIRVENDSLISDVEQLWRQFSLAPLNYELQQPLSDEEVKFNALSSPDLETLKRFSFNFTPDVVGAPRQTLMLRLRNNGFLKTSFRLHLPNEKELELEPWCDEDEPTPEKLMQVCILEELKSFEIEPRQCTLEPGETCTIRVGYMHNSLKYGGFHRLPILMRVSQGKQFWVDVVGQTLGASEHAKASIQTPGSISRKDLDVTPETMLLKAFVDPKSTVYLQNVPIGLPIQSAPIQRVVLVNVSATDVNYDVDHNCLRDVITDNMGIEVFKVYNPRGIIYARCTHILEVGFFPLEAREYHIPLVVRYYPMSHGVSNDAGFAMVPASRGGVSGGGPRKKIGLLSSSYLNINLKCLGYYPRIQRPLVPNTEFKGALPPRRQLLDLGHCIALSEDQVDFGVIPQKSETARLIILKNISEHKTVDFFVDDGSCALIESGFLSITPSYGRTAPGEEVVLHIRAHADVFPTIIEERFVIVTQEVITTKKATRGNRLKERLKSSSSQKLGSESHSTIVTRTTFTRSMQVELNPVPNGRVAKLPGTFVGNVHFSGANKNSSMDSPDKTLMSRSDGGNSFASQRSALHNVAMSAGASTVSGAQSLHFQSSVSQANMGSPAASFQNLNTPVGNVSSALTPALKTPKTGSTRGNLTTGFSDMQSTASGFTGVTSGRSGGTKGPQTLLGPRISYLVRVKGEVFEENIIAQLLQRPIDPETNNDEHPEILKTFVMPLKQPYVAPKAIRPFSAGGPASLAIGNLDDHSEDLSAKSELSLGAGLAGLPVSERQTEARAITSFILADLFKDLVSSPVMTTEISAKLSKPTGGASSKGLAMVRGTDADVVCIRGQAEYGVYIDEVREAAPTVQLLIQYCRFHKLFVPWKDVNNEIHTASKATLSKAASLMNSIDGIGFTEEASYIPLPSEYFVRKEPLFTALLDLGLKRKGKGYTSIKERLDESKLSFIDVVNDFFPRLDHSIADMIGRKLILTANKQKLADKLQRQSAKSKEDLTDAAVLIQNSIRKKIATRTVEKKRNVVALAKAKQAEIDAEKERQLLRKKKPELSEEQKNEQDQAFAAKCIQSIARAKTARNDFEKKNEESIDTRGALALCNEPGFLEIAAEVLRNTIFNIMQEAVQGEFVLDSEPLKFIVKRDSFLEEHEDGSNNKYQ